MTKANRPEPGEPFGELTVLGPAPSTRDGRSRSWCRCSCGVEKEITNVHLRSRDTISCGHAKAQKVHERMLGEVGTRARVKAAESPSNPARALETFAVSKNAYALAHAWVKAVKGSASSYPCTGCGQPARDWSLNPALATSTLYIARENGSVMLCSDDPDCYEPRCQPCHRRLDNDIRQSPAFTADMELLDNQTPWWRGWPGWTLPPETAQEAQETS